MKVIKVTQADIDNSIKMSITRCPLAIAGLKIDPDVGAIATAYFLTTFNRDTLQIINIYKLSQRAKQFVKKVDGGKPVKPINFRLVESHNKTYKIMSKHLLGKLSMEGG